MKGSDEEDTTILLKNGNQSLDQIVAMKPPIVEEHNIIPAKKIKKPIFKEEENLTPLTTGNQNIFMSIVAILAGYSFGYDMCIGKQVAPIIKSKFNLTCADEAFISNIWYFGALTGSVFGGFLIDKCGRRWTMIRALIILTFGSILSALANHFVLLIVARLVCGVSGIISAISHCVYMAEVSEPKKRGCNVSLHQLGIAAGFLVAVIVAAMKTSDYQWRFMIGATSVSALITCSATIIFLQRSPPFLLLKKENYVSKPARSNPWRPIGETVLIMLLMLVLQQTTGRQQVLYYAPRLFGLLGICANAAEMTTSIALGVVKLFSSVLALIVVERCGRRTALITSATICMTTMSLLALLATLDRGDDSLSLTIERCKEFSSNINEFGDPSRTLIPAGSPPPFPLLPTPLAISVPNTETWTQVKASCETQNVVTSEGLNGGLRILAVITLLVYESAYALGLGPVPLLTLSEVFPVKIRGKSVGFCIAVLWILHVVMTQSVVSSTRSLTLAGGFLLHSFMCLITISFVFLLYPETKGKTLHQVAQELRKIPSVTRVYNNLCSLPVICHLNWVSKLCDKTNSRESTLI